MKLLFLPTKSSLYFHLLACSVISLWLPKTLRCVTRCFSVLRTYCSERAEWHSSSTASSQDLRHLRQTAHHCFVCCEWFLFMHWLLYIKTMLKRDKQTILIIFVKHMSIISGRYVNHLFLVGQQNRWFCGLEVRVHEFMHITCKFSRGSKVWVGFVDMYRILLRVPGLKFLVRHVETRVPFHRGLLWISMWTQQWELVHYFYTLS